MAETTEISWAHSTFNPWIGCTNVSPGCDHCYAEALDHRWGHDRWGAGKPRQRTSPANWKQPLAWNRKAQESGQPWRVFCASLADVFDNEVPDEWRTDLWALIAATPALTWMLLTKRIGNVAYPMPANVWLGITVVNQDEADRDIPKLLRADARVRWLSCEPLLGPIDLTRVQWPGLHRVDVLRGGAWDMPGWHIGFVNHSDMKRIDWVIVGGESGAGARPMEADWARAIRDQCAEAGVAYHFKQWGGMRPKSNGHLLDGVEHREFPLHQYGKWDVTK